MKNLDKLLRPHSIAVVGGGQWAENVINRCLELGFQGQIWPVHPNRPSVAGYSAYPAIAALPAAPDAAFLAVNRNATIQAVQALSKLGAGGAVCLASGFAEAQAEDEGALSLQQQLILAAGEMPLVGPNCYGIINYLDRCALWPDQQGGKPVSSGVAIIAQSSNLAMNLTMQRRGLPVAYTMAIGNQAQTSMAEIARALLTDERVTALGLHVESFGDLRQWELTARVAHELGRPVIILKPGSSAKARAALVSHTAAIVGDDSGADALIRRLGFVRVDSVDQFLETLKLLHVFGALPSRQIASLSCSGGEASLIADAAARAAVEFAPLSDQQQQDLRAALGPIVALNNPLDYHTYIWRDYSAMLQTFKGIISKHNALNFLILDYARADLCDNRDWQTAADAAIAASVEREARLALVASIPETMPEEQASRLIAKGVTPMLGLDAAMTAVVQAEALHQARPSELPLLLAPAVNKPAQLYSEAEAKRLLSESGLLVPEAERAADVDAVLEAAERIGYPVVLKGEGVAHKTEAGAVRLNLSSAQELRSAAEAMPASSFLVEEQIDDIVAELLLGVLRDPAHGFILTIGAGGKLAELLSDSVSLLIPASAEEIEAALRSLRSYKLLAGYRGGAAADLGAIIAAVQALQSFVEQRSESLAEVEINPLLCCPQRAVVADALLRC